MILYAIRRVTDNKLLPLRADGRHTHAEFDSYGPPRMFLTRGAALKSLSMWRQGIWRTGTSWESVNEYGEGFYYQGLPEPTGKHARTGIECDVVPITLVW